MDTNGHEFERAGARRQITRHASSPVLKQTPPLSLFRVDPCDPWATRFLLFSGAARTVYVAGMTDKALRVLVADDDANIGDTFRRIITSLGHACDVVADGRECLKKVAQNTYDILFLDLIMPKLDGEAVLHSLKGRDNPKDIIIISSEDDEDVITDILHRGATAFIVKPIELASVEQVIDETLRRRS
jgi:CheY-like chemotaxis protein